MLDEREQESDNYHVGLFILSCVVLIVSGPLACAGLLTHSRPALATVTSLQPSISNIRLECKISFTYDGDATQYVGRFFGDVEICKYHSEVQELSHEQTPVTYNVWFPNLYYASEGKDLYFEFGVIAAVIAALAFCSMCALAAVQEIPNRRRASMR